MNSRIFFSTLIFCLASAPFMVKGEDDLDELRAETVAAMKRGATFFRTHVASHGGYVYHYAIDLQRRWGEGEATKDQIWVQPPGTPTVGLAYLAAYHATGDTYYLSAVEEVADALRYGQLKSGGWTNCIDFDPQGERLALYRNGQGRGKNNSSLDDGQTQTATRLMIRADQALNFQHQAIHEAAQFALDSLLAAQFPCGGFPQVWTESVAAPPPRKAKFPTYDWRTEGKIKEYWKLYTLNDNVAVNVAHTLGDAYAVYGQDKYLQAIRRLGDFLILAQMPEPQPAWAQQYNFDMQPVWARRFEPPAIAGHESQGAIELLMDIYVATGDEKYLKPIPAAIEYLRRSTLKEGQLARYYELQTNRPLYMQRAGNDYTLTYDDSNLPAHYGWKTPSQVGALQSRYDSIRSRPDNPQTERETGNLVESVRTILRTMDSQGRWVSRARGERLVGQQTFPEGTEYLSSAVFSENLTTLADFLQAE